MIQPFGDQTLIMPLKIQEYLQPQNIENIQTAKFLFEARKRMLDAKSTQKNELKCHLKCDSDDTRMHLLHLSKKCLNTKIFFQQITNKVASMLEGRFQIRKKADVQWAHGEPVGCVLKYLIYFCILYFQIKYIYPLFNYFRLH